jgi:hypothetical protein
MDKYAQLKRHADELSRLLSVPFAGNEMWDKQFAAALDEIEVFRTGRPTAVPEPEPAIVEQEPVVVISEPEPPPAQRGRPAKKGK